MVVCIRILVCHDQTERMDNLQMVDNMVVVCMMVENTRVVYKKEVYMMVVCMMVSLMVMAENM